MIQWIEILNQQTNILGNSEENCK